MNTEFEFLETSPLSKFAFSPKADRAEYDCAVVLYEALPAKLSDAQIDALVPVLTYGTPGDSAVNVLAQALNWADHSAPFLLAFEWVYEHLQGEALDYTAAAQAFDALSETQKAMVQRGYQIKYLGFCPPLLGNQQYAYYVKICESAYEKGDFPILHSGLEGHDLLGDSFSSHASSSLVQ